VHTTVTPFAARKNGTATVTDAVALADPDVAVIVATPLATEVTSPADDTVARDELDVAHVTVGLGIVAPSASVTVATSVAVAPSDVNDRLVGASATAAAT
jgi:copper(I)-binding protein